MCRRRAWSAPNKHCTDCADAEMTGSALGHFTRSLGHSLHAFLHPQAVSGLFVRLSVSLEVQPLAAGRGERICECLLEGKGSKCDCRTDRLATREPKHNHYLKAMPSYFGIKIKCQEYVLFSIFVLSNMLTFIMPQDKLEV